MSEWGNRLSYVRIRQAGRQRERGFVLVTMAVSAAALFGALGLSVDLGRIFIAKNETQAFCDGAALSAALMLNGTSTGITNARNSVATSVNRWNFGTTNVTSPAVTFATSSAGPWSSAPLSAAGYGFARVTASAPVPLYFITMVVPRTTQTVTAAGTAAQVAVTSLPRGLSPYTAVSTNTLGPNFGLTVGDSYDIQWPQYNGTRAGCGAGNPDRCFVSPTCAGDTHATKAAVVTNWGASINGFWGGSSNSIIQQEILDLIQLQPLTIGDNLYPVLTAGNKASQAGYLDERATQDTNRFDNTVSAYLAATHNGRRLLPVPIVNPLDPTHTTVIGYGQFLLYANGTNNYYRRITNGNDPFCAVYAGPYNIGSTTVGAGGTTGATRVKLVL